LIADFFPLGGHEADGIVFRTYITTNKQDFLQRFHPLSLGELGELRGAFGSWVKQPRQLELTVSGRVQYPLALYQQEPEGIPRGAEQVAM
jgi:hypothetical protein